MIGLNDTHAPDVISTVKEVLTALGEDLNTVSAEDWSYNPRTGYLRFNRLIRGEDGGRVLNLHAKETRRIRVKRKVPPFWRERLEFKWRAAYDDSTL